MVVIDGLVTQMMPGRPAGYAYGLNAPTSLLLYSLFHKVYLSKLYLMAKAGKNAVSLSLGLSRNNCHF